MRFAHLWTQELIDQVSTAPIFLPSVSHNSPLGITGRNEVRGPFLLDQGKTVALITSSGDFTLLDLDGIDAVYGVGRWNPGYQGHLTNTSKKIHTHIHRVVLEIQTLPRGMEVDHINRNPMDNRKVNLRVVTNSDNQRNRAPRPLNARGFYVQTEIASDGVRRFFPIIHLQGHSYQTHEEALTIAKSVWLNGGEELLRSLDCPSL